MHIRAQIFSLALLFVVPASSRAQHADSLWTIEMRGVVVSATRTPKALEDVAVPLRVLSGETARREGSVRLADLFDELASARVVRNQFGAGLQLRGLDPAYTLILIDGEAVVGRSGGTVDLDRLSLLDVERVEIVKGPSSSLYGSEALAGVVNIITRAPSRTGLSFTSQYETHETSHLALRGSAATGPFVASLTGNRYASSGYDLFPETPGDTSPRFTDRSLSGQVRYAPKAGKELKVRARLAEVDNKSQFGSAESTSGREDFELSTQGHWRLSSDFRLTGSAFLTTASNHNDLFDITTPGNDLTTDLKITFRKAEALLTWLGGGRSIITFGSGATGEASEGARIAGGRRRSSAVFAFGQHEWLPNHRLQVTTSARADRHTEYGLHLSPKTAVLWKPDEWRLRGSVGTGFKAPTSQQRYMDFVNPGSGYAVVGATDSAPFLDALEASGQLAYRSQDWSAGDLEPERAVTGDLGVERSIGDRWEVSGGAFATAIRDMIETQPIGAKSNGQTLFSYVNLTRVSIRGLDASVEWLPSRSVQAELEYQFLQARDVDVLEQIDEGRLFRRIDGRDVRLTRDDYGGLFGRSAHNATLRAGYVRGKSDFTARLILRSRYGIGDRNGNLVLDDDAEYAPRHALLHATVRRRFNGHATASLTVRNITDRRYPDTIPSLSGRLVQLRLDLNL